MATRKRVSADAHRESKLMVSHALRLCSESITTLYVMWLFLEETREY